MKIIRGENQLQINCKKINNLQLIVYKFIVIIIIPTVVYCLITRSYYNLVIYYVKHKRKMN